MTKHVSSISNSSPPARRYARDHVVAPVQQADETVGLMDVWALVKRRAWLVGTIVLACTVLAAIATFTVSQNLHCKLGGGA